MSFTLRFFDENGQDWINRKQQIQLFIKKCATCQKNNQRKSLAVCRPFTLSSDSPMQKIFVDLIEDLREDEDGNKHIVVLIDSFSRYIMLYPIKEKTSRAVSKAILLMIGDYGAPKTLVSDRGPCFISDVLRDLLQFLGTEHEFTLSYSKEENGMVERANKETMRHLRNIVFDRNV